MDTGSASGSWTNTRKSLLRLKNFWQKADEDTKYDMIFWFGGMTMMALAIVDQFGWSGAVFCLGLVIWRAGSVGTGAVNER